MQIIRNISMLRKRLAPLRGRKQRIGLVPTMGFLHEGHLSLVRKARRDCGIVVVSIFVNPTQFGPKEDLKKYPRNLKRDGALLKKEKVDFIFHPSVDEMYPEGSETTVSPGPMADCLCGAKRPGHFKGVLTVVAKFFNIVLPDTAYFGGKDYQQAVLIKRMVRDLNFDVKIKVCPLVRDSDGLALSSRNIYLSEAERKKALSIHDSLKWAKVEIKKGLRDVKKLTEGVKKILKPNVTKIDYVEIRDAESLATVKKINKKVVIAVAAYVGKTRLIDNKVL